MPENYIYILCMQHNKNILEECDAALIWLSVNKAMFLETMHPKLQNVFKDQVKNQK